MAIDDSFIHLVDGYLEGKLDKRDLKRFLGMIEESPENRDVLALNAFISRLIRASKCSPVSAEKIIMSLPRHGDTAKLIIERIRSSGNPVVQEGGRKVPAAGKNGLNGKKKSLLEKAKYGIKPEGEPSGMIYFFRALTAVAACALLVFGVWRYAHQQPAGVMSCPELAMLDCRGDVAIRRGSGVMSVHGSVAVCGEDTVLVGDHAMALLRYNGENTTLKIQEETALKIGSLNGAKNLSLRHGTVEACVSTQPEKSPMTLTTPKAFITVVGTRFRLKTIDASTLLDVNSGKVRVTRSCDNSSIDVSEGKSVEVTDNAPLLVSAARNIIVGHLARKQVEDMFQTMSTAKAAGINTLTFDVTTLEASSFPQELRSAIATAHRSDVRFLARLDIPGDAAGNCESFINPVRNKLPQLVLDYNFDGIYLTYPDEMKNSIVFDRIAKEILQVANKTAVSMETGIHREINTNETWFVGY